MDRAGALTELAHALAEGKKTSTVLTREYLTRIVEAHDGGARSFTRVFEERAIGEAEAADLLRRRGLRPSPLAGIPISVKDLFDVIGVTTQAGSIALAKAPAATADAKVVQRLRAAGAILVGKTNMTEFAYSALGLNPHYGTPVNPFDAARIPGGSSSGAATAVAYDLCAASIATDTAGSVRIPAAFCGLVGFKPTQDRIPRDGVFPLSRSLDSIGSIARTVACCALLDERMANACHADISSLPVQGLRLAVPERPWTESLDPVVARAYDRVLRDLANAGACLISQELPAIAGVADLERCGALIGPEAYATHRTLLERHGEAYDPRVRSRLTESGRSSAADYIEALRLRRDAIERFSGESRAFDAILAPTVAVVPPRFDELEDESEYRRINALVRRNAALVNLVDGCALSLPCHVPGELPVGLMIIGRRHADSHVLAIGMALERLLRTRD